MSAIAYNIQGEPFEVPPHVVAFRAKRLKPRGAPEVFYGIDGLPLVVPVDAGIDEVRSLIGDIADGETLRLRLDPIDEEGRLVDKVPPAYVQVTPRRCAPVAEASVRPALGSDAVSVVVLEAMRTNANLAQAVVEKLPAIMDAAAKVLAAADGAGMPTRAPLALPAPAAVAEEKDASSKEESRPRNATAEMLESISAVMDSAWPYAKIAATVFGNRGGARNSVAAALDESEPAADNDRLKPPPRTERPDVQAPSDPGEVMRHMNAVQSRLTDEERSVARAAAAEMSPEEVQRWIAALGKLSVDEAVAEVRRLIGGAKAGGAS